MGLRCNCSSRGKDIYGTNGFVCIKKTLKRNAFIGMLMTMTRLKEKNVRGILLHNKIRFFFILPDWVNNILLSSSSVKTYKVVNPGFPNTNVDEDVLVYKKQGLRPMSEWLTDTKTSCILTSGVQRREVRFELHSYVY